MMRSNNIQTFHSEKFGEIKFLIEKIDEPIQPYHIEFFGTFIDGEHHREVKLEMVKKLRQDLSPKLRRAKIVWQKEHNRIPITPTWKPYYE